MLKKPVKGMKPKENGIEALYNGCCNCSCACTCKDNTMMTTAYADLQAIPKSNASAS